MIFKPSRRKFLVGTSLFAAALFHAEQAMAAFAIFQVNGNPWPAIDGSANAPTGTPQFPSVLNGYPTGAPPGARTLWPSNGSQPAWRAPGIDYRVGINTGVSLTPASSLPTSGSPRKSGTTVIMDVANSVLNGYDLTDFAIQISADGCIVENCKFFVSSGNPSSLVDVWVGLSGGTNLTVQNCEFDFTNFTSSSRPAIINSISNGITIEYNYFKNTFSDFISAAGGLTTIKYNLFNQTQALAAGAHGDVWQMTGSGCQLVAQFNTCVMNIPGSGVNGLQAFYLANGTGWVGTQECGYNVFTGVGTPNGDATGGSYIGLFGDVGLAPYSVHDNYIDPLWCRTGTVYHDLNGITATGNINMNNGAALNS